MLAQAIEVLATQPLGREQVDWRALQAELERDIVPEAPPSAAHAAIKTDEEVQNGAWPSAEDGTAQRAAAWVE